jgi:hypothetical protein
VAQSVEREGETDRTQLAKEDEATPEVTKEDQSKINSFSRLHQREINLEEELKAKHVRPAHHLPYPETHTPPESF